MRLLLDECVPARLRRALAPHTVSTVVKNLQYQQNAVTLPIAVLVLDAVSNDITHLLPLVPKIEAALDQLVAGSFILVIAEA